MAAQDDQQSLKSGDLRRYSETDTSSEDDDEPYVNRNLYTSEVAGKWNLVKLLRNLGTREQGLAFAEEHALLRKSKECPVHNTPMKIEFSTNITVGSFVCDKGSCNSQVARANGTWFENAKILVTTVYYLMYCFVHNFEIENAIREDFTRIGNQCLSPVTIVDWYNYCRGVVVLYQKHTQRQKGKIGGSGKIIQIDECKFGKRTYDSGIHIGDHWVLVLIEDGGDDLRLEVCPDNKHSDEELVALIKRHVAEGTTICTDLWKAYDCLGEHGFIHKPVNHANPDNPHTQRINAQWREVKRFFHIDNYNNYCRNFEDMCYEYLWCRRVIKYNKDPFSELIKAIKHVYKIK